MANFWKSAVLYFRLLGKGVWFIVISVAGGISGLALDAFGVQSIPSWIWVTTLILAAFFTPFWAFHKLRLATDQLAEIVNGESESVLASLANNRARDRATRKVVMAAIRRAGKLDVKGDRVLDYKVTNEQVRQVGAWVTETYVNLLKVYGAMASTRFGDATDVPSEFDTKQWDLERLVARRVELLTQMKEDLDR